MPRHRSLVVLVPLALAGGVLAWLATRPTSEGTAALPRSAGEAAARGALEPNLYEPALDLAALPAGASTAGRAVVAGALSEGPSATSTPREPLRLLVRGQVRGPVPDLHRTRLELRPSDWPTQRGRPPRLVAFPDGDGKFDVDATSLIEGGPLSRPPKGLELEVDHPACPRLEQAVSLREHWGGRLDVRMAELAGTKVSEVEILLEAGAVLRGRLQPPPGIDPRSVVLAAARGGAGAEPAASWLTTTRTDAVGDFALRVAPGGSCVVVAACARLRPATRVVEIPASGEYLVELELERGLAVAGHLRLGRDPAPAGVAVVLAHEPCCAAHHSLGPGLDSLVWVEGAYEWRSRSARTRSDGSFAVDGLGSQERALRVLGLGMPGVHARAIEAGVARPPQDGLELGPLLAQAELRFAAAPEWPVTFHLRETGSGEPALGPFHADDEGRARLWLPPRATYAIELGRDVVGQVSLGAAGTSSRWSPGR